jgi:hypothetical protein
MHRQVSNMDEKIERIATSVRSATGESLPRIFISYSRKDGSSFAADLREKLRKQHLSIW